MNNQRVLQIDPRMPYPICQWGCNFRSLLGIVETLQGAVFTPEQILWAWVEAQWRKEDGIQGMLKNGLVQVPKVVLDLGFALLGLHTTGYDIGSTGPLGESFWGWVQDKTIHATILKGKTVNGNDHFREGDPRGKLLWDPSPETVIAEEKAVIYYQVKDLA